MLKSIYFNLKFAWILYRKETMFMKCMLAFILLDTLAMLILLAIIQCKL